MSTKFKVYSRETGNTIKLKEGEHVVMTQNGRFLIVGNDGWYDHVRSLDMSRFQVRFKENMKRLVDKYKD